MYFGLSEEQSFFQDNVRKYLEEHATIDNIKHIASGDEKNLSAEIHQGLLNLGINGLLIPEEFDTSEPPMMVINKKYKLKLLSLLSKVIPEFDILLRTLIITFKPSKLLK